MAWPLPALFSARLEHAPHTDPKSRAVGDHPGSVIGSAPCSLCTLAVVATVRREEAPPRTVACGFPLLDSPARLARLTR